MDASSSLADPADIRSSLPTNFLMNPVYIPAASFEEWRAFTAQPDKHWVPGRSAMSIAESWHNADGFPEPVDAVFQVAGQPFSSMKPLLVIPEHKVPLPGGNRAAQNDVWVLARHETGLASITVEGKVDETFGEVLEDWIKDASPSKRERLNFLWRKIGLLAEPHGKIRYQLLHRAASALIEAERFHTDHAVMLVHSFSREDIGLEDFRAFTHLFGVSSQPDQLVRLSQPSNVPLYTAWIRHPANSAICLQGGTHAAKS